MRPLRSFGLIIAWLACAGAAAAQGACPANGSELPSSALYGNWEARFEGIPGVAVVKLERHPDYDGVRGTITRNGKGSASVARLAGDIGDDGVLNLDESQDGQTISGSWVGELQPASCGKQFKGNWRNAQDDSTLSFTLDKTGDPGNAR